MSATPYNRIAAVDEHGDGAVVLLVARDPMIGAQFDQGIGATGVEQHAMQVCAVHHGVRVAEIRAERGVQRYVDDLLGGKAIHQPKLIDIDRYRARRVADPEIVEGMEGVRADLDTRADLAEFWRGFQNDRADAVTCKTGRRGQSADSAPGDHERSAVHGETSRQFVNSLYTVLCAYYCAIASAINHRPVMMDDWQIVHELPAARGCRRRQRLAD